MSQSLDYLNQLKKNQKDAKMAVVVARQGRTLYEIEGYARAIMSDVSVTKIDADRVLISLGLNKKGLTEFCNNGIKKFFPGGYIVPLPCPIGNLDDLRRAEHALIAIGDQGTSIAQLAEHPMELLRSCERVAGQGRVLHCRSGKPSAARRARNTRGKTRPLGCVFTYLAAQQRASCTTRWSRYRTRKAVASVTLAFS
jgi:hypothetical protein